MDIRISRRRTSGAVLRTVLVALSLLVPGSALSAQEVSLPQTPHPEAQKAIESLRSPYCPGLMLEVCTSLQGALLRDSIQTMAEEGWTSEQLVDWVLENHGDTLLALPRARGRSLIAWVIPPAVFLLGLGLVLVTLRVMRKRAGPEDEEKTAELSPEDETRLAEALEELEEEEEPVF